MTNVCFHDELHLVKELAVEFSIANPALAPLLEGKMTDPDVLEAMAFQNDFSIGQAWCILRR